MRIKAMQLTKRGILRVASEMASSSSKHASQLIAGVKPPSDATIEKETVPV